ncbi:MAG: caspase family protein [Proteobacteria bacterium]|nr:caspase family protein [Pseudomonadota bacterium]
MRHRIYLSAIIGYKLSIKLLFLISISILYSAFFIVYAENKILGISSPNGLSYTDNDAKLVSAAFGRYAGFRRKNIRTIIGDQSTKETIFHAIDNWLNKDVKRTDLIILFVAGHGVILHNQYYFVPEGKDIEMTEESLLAARRNGLLVSKTELQISLNKNPSVNKMLVIDTCRSGAFFDSAGTGFSPVRNANDIVRGIVAAIRPMTPSPQPLKKTDFTVISACRSDQFASESSKFKNGILTHYLVQVLKGKAWENDIFDASAICKEISTLAEKEGWSQEALAYGGVFFTAELKPDPIQHFVTY